MPIKDPQARREYAKKYREANREKLNEYSRAYGPGWYKENKSRHLSNGQNWRKRNAGPISNYRKMWYSTTLKPDAEEVLENFELLPRNMRREYALDLLATAPVSILKEHRVDALLAQYSGI